MIVRKFSTLLIGILAVLLNGCTAPQAGGDGSVQCSAPDFALEVADSSGLQVRYNSDATMQVFGRNGKQVSPDSEQENTAEGRSTRMAVFEKIEPGDYTIELTFPGDAEPRTYGVTVQKFTLTKWLLICN